MFLKTDDGSAFKANKVTSILVSAYPSAPSERRYLIRLCGPELSTLTYAEEETREDADIRVDNLLSAIAASANPFNGKIPEKPNRSAS